MALRITWRGARRSRPFAIAVAIVLLSLLFDGGDRLFAQESKRPPRAIPPSVEDLETKDLFFEDLDRVLVGEVPWNHRRIAKNTDSTSTDMKSSLQGLGTGNRNDQSDSLSRVHSSIEGIPEWVSWITSESIEDLVKESKLRLDQTLRTPSGFAGGGSQQARIEFSLLSLLFGIIEVYPEPIRWKNSSASMKQAMYRAATGTNLGSSQMFQSARDKQRDLDAVLRGETMAHEPATEVEWGNLIDIGPLMKLMSLAYEQHVVPGVANQTEFAKRGDELARYSQLIAILSAVAMAPGMPNFDDDQFCGTAAELADSARSISSAIENKDADAARIASGRMGQSCQKCHDDYR